MTSDKAAQLTSDLLATKGTATPSSANRESLGPDKVRQAIAKAQSESAPKPPAAKPKRNGRVSLSLRLDADRHRRLKLATIHLGESAQGILIQALDDYLDQVANDLLAISRATGEDAAGSTGVVTEDET